jgi:hypothetical protein
MKFFEWLNGPQQTEVERAIALLSKQESCVNFGIDKNVNANVLLIGKYKTIHTFSLEHILGGRGRKRYFSYYTVKFGESGESAMISKNGGVDFFFNTEEEVSALREAITKRFG